MRTRKTAVTTQAGFPISVQEIISKIMKMEVTSKEELQTLDDAIINPEITAEAWGKYLCSLQIFSMPTLFSKFLDDLFTQNPDIADYLNNPEKNKIKSDCLGMAYYYLGRMFRDGKGCPQNINEAYKYLTLSGFGVAQAELAYLLQEHNHSLKSSINYNLNKLIGSNLTTAEAHRYQFSLQENMWNYMTCGYYSQELSLKQRIQKVIKLAKENNSGDDFRHIIFQFALRLKTSQFFSPSVNLQNGHKAKAVFILCRHAANLDFAEAMCELGNLYEVNYSGIIQKEDDVADMCAFWYEKALVKYRSELANNPKDLEPTKIEKLQSQIQLLEEKLQKRKPHVMLSSDPRIEQPQQSVNAAISAVSPRQARSVVGLFKENNADNLRNSRDEEAISDSAKNPGEKRERSPGAPFETNPEPEENKHHKVDMAGDATDEDENLGCRSFQPSK